MLACFDQQHYLYLRLGMNVANCFRDIWTYVFKLIYIHIASITSGASESIDDLHRLTEICHQQPRLLRDPTDEIKGMILEMSANGGIPQETIPNRVMLEIARIEANDWFVEALELAGAIMRKERTVVTVDTLEQYDIETFWIDAYKGVCQAVRSATSKQSFPGMDIKCFLPEEIAPDLFAPNPSKYNDMAISLTWTYSELLEMFARRFSSYLAEFNGDQKVVELKAEVEKVLAGENKLKKTPGYWRDKFWTLVGPKKVQNRKGWHEDSCAYLIRHTQKRPREILLCMNHVVWASERRNEQPFITERTLKEGLHCERNLTTLLDDTLSVFLPKGGNVALGTLVEKVFRNEGSLLTGADFMRFCKRAYADLPSELATREYVEKMVWRSGLIGERVERRDWEQTISGRIEECRYYETAFCYCRAGQLVFNEKSECALHPILSDKISADTGEDDMGVVYHVIERDDLVPMTT